MLNKTLPHLPLRNLDGERLFDYFLISGISSILTIRLFLYLTGYPQLGNGSFHVDHMLWGGFFMLSALVVSFFFLTRSARATSAVLGGLGFGMFIDELGKLVTRDDNYLYQPVIALIYSIFVLLYLFSRIIEKQRKVTQKEYLIN
ncbi:hypothetical protein M1307_03740, partial [Patescibacteria group bacterium]|nr:hypothetical protein [Patescibacteria group bacterium]